MPVTAVVGSQWGDEGKGKVTDVLTRSADVVARFQGGNNAGHTVVVGGDEHKFHLLPSGVVRPGVVNVIGNGAVVNPEVLLEELEELREAGVDPDLRVSDRAHVILPYHQVLDGAEEDAREDEIGTTGRGIGPTYADKMARVGVRMGDLLDEDALRDRLADALPEKRTRLEALGRDPDLDLDDLVARFREHGKRLAARVEDTTRLLNDAVDGGDSVLLEGAQGTFLDIDHGSYPYVTSSNTTAGGAATGTGLPPHALDHVLGVVKAYTTRVGGGPLPTELDPGEDPGKHLVEVGDEFGTTTGRRRRVGWLDLPALRRAARINGFSSVAVTKVDVLEGLDPVRVCTAYEVDGETLEELPSQTDDLARAEPVYEDLDGFDETLVEEAPSSRDDLTEGALTVVEMVEEAAGCPASMVSYGPGREEAVVLEDPLA
jgi:adenylosuccinate synthase